MSDPQPPPTTPAAGHPVAPAPPSPWGKRLAYGVAALIVLVAVAWISAAFVPRWWAQRVGDQVDGSIATGITLGLAYGFLFTVLPLLVVAWALRARRSWKLYLAFAALAAVLALPNLFTLSIVVGTGNAAHAGERILDVRAPGFRAATLAGAILAALFVLGVGHLVRSRRRAQQALERLRASTLSEEPTEGAS